MKTKKFAALCFASLLALLSDAASAQPYTISADGQEVIDMKTGLIWRRCAEGMAYSGGTCTGVAGTFSHEAALTQARTQSASTGVAWRLPNVKELSSIVDRSRVSPAIDAAAFPAVPVGMFWSASPYVGNSVRAWYVAFYYGNADAINRFGTYYVRLVR